MSKFMNIFNIKTEIPIYTLLLVSLFFCHPVNKAFALTPENRSPQFLFFFKKNNILLLPAYKNNDAQLKQLEQWIEHHRANIENYYFSILSYVSPENALDYPALNTASLQGSVIRAYIRTYFHLSEGKFIFQIDTLENRNNQTSITLLPLPAPERLSAIHYSLDKNPDQIKKAMTRYRQMPYVGSIYNKELTATSQQPPSWHRILMENIQKTDSLSNVIDHLNKEKITKQQIDDSIRQSDSIFLYKEIIEFYSYTKGPFIGVKTNLVYWAGFTPEMRWKQILPNLALELYLGKHWSLEFNGAYTRRLINGNHPKSYAFSTFGAEGRYWLKSNYRFDGFYGGIYTNGGEFDITPKHTDDEGHTGKYIGAGLSVGYTQMFSNWFGLELGVRGGFRHVSYDTYRRETSNYYYESTKYKNGIRLDGVFLNIIFRFEKYKK